MMLIVAYQVWGTRGVSSRETAMKRFVGVAKACCVNFLRTEYLHIAARLLCDCITFHFCGLWNRRFSIRSHTPLSLAFLTLIAERCGYWTPGFITVHPTNERIFGRDPPSVITIYNPSCAVGSVYTKKKLLTKYELTFSLKCQCTIQKTRLVLVFGAQGQLTEAPPPTCI